MKTFFINFSFPDIIQQLAKQKMKSRSECHKTMTEGIIELLKVGRKILKRDKEVVRSTQQKDCEFWSIFEVGAITAITVYNMLIVKVLCLLKD